MSLSAKQHLGLLAAALVLVVGIYEVNYHLSRPAAAAIAVGGLYLLLVQRSDMMEANAAQARNLSAGKAAYEYHHGHARHDGYHNGTEPFEAPAAYPKSLPIGNPAGLAAPPQKAIYEPIPVLNDDPSDAVYVEDGTVVPSAPKMQARNALENDRDYGSVASLLSERLQCRALCQKRQEIFKATGILTAPVETCNCAEYPVPADAIGGSPYLSGPGPAVGV